ncbi:tyrosine-type recombinase/integrase [Streptomyces sp. ISL-94]|uniref:tyrosine-type recombinase/integrase n=1 Tax=Streptomyces sp. ISL-94 TaxID=2819190 RepID=UPI001BE8B54E|nr:tyrosine-type recombinase/integrase [Streptomyces sp. ISL-94]MBT2478125.1 tyrosine-type recombinase/integrase [Streptomyces sp. ISL-94]
MTSEIVHTRGVIDAELVETVPQQAAGSGVTAYDPAVAAVLHALDRGAQEHLDAVRPRKTRVGYARDWALWEEFHGWLAERTGVPLPVTAVDRGTLVAFVAWLDEVKEAAPNSIDRRITGVTTTARRPPYGVEVPKEATLAARTALKPLKNDRLRRARGRGQAAPASPAQLRAMNSAGPTEGLPDLAVYRDRALVTLAFGIAGRAEEVSALTLADIVLVEEGLEVHVPSVKGRPARDVEIAWGAHPDSCPVLNWLAWKGAAEAAGLGDSGPAFRAVDRWGHLGTGRLSPDGCRLAITRSGRRAGLEVKVTGHSMRSGFITTGARNGKRPDQLRRQSGHSPSSAVFWEYVRKGARWEETASQGIGL